ncbi:MAG: pseudaminic acid cytidylyltransferase [Lachnospiraceae bacterium]|nr:pseudaminic acid cytidylyltransferase [Lachnospiraceae bacterium]
MSSIAIITARGGSKRIPKKNIKDFCGKPIIAYSIEAALKSGIFDEVMVSTDSEEIAQIARKYGASVPFMRSETTSNDYATTADVILEVIDEYKKLGKEFDDFTCIYPTAPFVTEAKLIDAYSLLQNDNADSVVSVVKYDFPPQRAFVIRNNMLQFQYPECRDSRSQDLEPIYHDCGQFYICKTSAFMKAKSLLTDRSAPYFLNPEEVQDIDNQSDWNLAEIKYSTFAKIEEQKGLDDGTL